MENVYETAVYAVCSPIVQVTYAITNPSLHAVAYFGTLAGTIYVAQNSPHPLAIKTGIIIALVLTMLYLRHTRTMIDQRTTMYEFVISRMLVSAYWIPLALILARTL